VAAAARRAIAEARAEELREAKAAKKAAFDSQVRDLHTTRSPAPMFMLDSLNWEYASMLPLCGRGREFIAAAADVVLSYRHCVTMWVGGSMR
jgi:hypothetical protein